MVQVLASSRAISDDEFQSRLHPPTSKNGFDYLISAAASRGLQDIPHVPPESSRYCESAATNFRDRSMNMFDSVVVDAENNVETRI